MENTITPYDAGSVDVNTTETMVLMETDIRQLLIYPTVDAKVSLNDSTTKEIFLPKGMWTAISISRDFICANFVVTGTAEGKIHWQGWVL